MDEKQPPVNGPPEPAADNAGTAAPKPKKKLGRRPNRLGPWKPRFLKFVRQWHGLAVAAVKAGIHPRTVERARKKDQRFNSQVELALTVREERLDRLVLERALAGSDRLLLAFGKAHLPHLYGRYPKPDRPVKSISVIKLYMPGPPVSPPVVADPGGLRELSPADPAPETPTPEAAQPKAASGVRFVIGRPVGESHDTPARPGPGLPTHPSLDRPGPDLPGPS
jgi:hypothetical protein